MTDDLRTDFPEAAPFIQEAVEEHGEEWVLDNYYQQLYPLRVIIEMPEKDELPFYDEEKHSIMSRSEIVDMYEGLAEHRENLRSNSKTTEE